MFKVIIKKDVFNKIKNEDSFINAIVLSRIVNCLRSNQRCFIRTWEDDEITGIKDRFDLMLFHGAMLYDAIKSFKKLSSQLRNLDTYKKFENEIKIINKQFGDGKSFRNTILDLIRNKLMFHFDSSFVKETISTFDRKDEIIFAQGKTGTHKDFIFLLPEDIAANYIIDNVNIKGSPEDRFDFYHEEINKISKLFCNIVENLIYELIKDICIFIKE